MTYIVRFGVTAEWFAAAPDDRCNRTGPAITQVPHPVLRAAGIGGNKYDAVLDRRYPEGFGQL